MRMFLFALCALTAVTTTASARSPMRFENFILYSEPFHAPTGCDRVVRIPMVGQSDSLNLAIATSVLLYQVFNQRRPP